MPYGWEGNRRPGVALAMRHRLKWFIHLWAHSLDREMSTLPTLSQWSMAHLSLPVNWPAEQLVICLEELQFDCECVYMSRDLVQLTYLGAGENNLTSLPREIGQSFSLYTCPQCTSRSYTVSASQHNSKEKSTVCQNTLRKYAQFHRKFVNRV